MSEKQTSRAGRAGPAKPPTTAQVEARLLAMGHDATVRVAGDDWQRVDTDGVTVWDSDDEQVSTIELARRYCARGGFVPGLNRQRDEAPPAPAYSADAQQRAAGFSHPAVAPPPSPPKKKGGGFRDRLDIDWMEKRPWLAEQIAAGATNFELCTALGVSLSTLGMALRILNLADRSLRSKKRYKPSRSLNISGVDPEYKRALALANARGKERGVAASRAACELIAAGAKALGVTVPEAAPEAGK